jgi:hypothetical protein
MLQNYQVQKQAEVASTVRAAYRLGRRQVTSRSHLVLPWRAGLCVL